MSSARSMAPRTSDAVHPGERQRPKRRVGEHVPNLRECVRLPGAGHWVQQERAAAINGVLVRFLEEATAGRSIAAPHGG